MSRRRKAVKRDVMADPKYGDKTVSKFTSCLMYDGKRSIAEKIVYGAFEAIKRKLDQSQLKSFMMR
jgi:small subunit ribosomal protein S7